MFDNINNAQKFFFEYYNNVDASGCPLCKRHFQTKRYIYNHILLHCPVTDNAELSPQLLSQIYHESTNTKKKTPTKRTPCLIWSNFVKFISWEKDIKEGIRYNILLQSGAIVTVRNVELLKSRSGERIAKQGYRLRKRGLLEHSTINSPATYTTATILTTAKVPPNNKIISKSTSKRITSSNSPAHSIPSLYPGASDSSSQAWIVSKITLTAGRIKQLKSTMNKWSELSGGQSVINLLQQGETWFRV
jgi:hypothetical protein